MGKREVLEKLVKISVDFHARGNVGLTTLYKESGYFDCFQEIGVDDIAQVLKEGPTVVESWLIYSSDKRTDSG